MFFKIKSLTFPPTKNNLPPYSFKTVSIKIISSIPIPKRKDCFSKIYYFIHQNNPELFFSPSNTGGT